MLNKGTKFTFNNRKVPVMDIISSPKAGIQNVTKEGESEFCYRINEGYSGI